MSQSFNKPWWNQGAMSSLAFLLASGYQPITKAKKAAKKIVKSKTVADYERIEAAKEKRKRKGVKRYQSYLNCQFGNRKYGLPKTVDLVSCTTGKPINWRDRRRS